MIIKKSFVCDKLPKYNVYQHKNDRGRILILGSSIGMTGAVCMAANAALRSGCGLVTAGVPRSLNNIFEVKLTEAMSLPLPDTDGRFSDNAYKEALSYSEKCNCVAIGPGGGVNPGLKNAVYNFIEKFEKKLLIDADGINVIDDTDILLNKKCDLILTPHVGEFSRLTGLDVDFINKNREKTAKEFALKHNVTLLLKGKETVITDGERTLINSTGNEGMATGGSGDVLSGIISSFMAQGMSSFDAGACGAYIHGLAGDFAKEEKTVYSMTASDIIDNLPNAFREVLNNEL